MASIFDNKVIAPAIISLYKVNEIFNLSKTCFWTGSSDQTMLNYVNDNLKNYNILEVLINSKIIEYLLCDSKEAAIEWANSKNVGDFSEDSKKLNPVPNADNCYIATYIGISCLDWRTDTDCEEVRIQPKYFIQIKKDSCNLNNNNQVTAYYTLKKVCNINIDIIVKITDLELYEGEQKEWPGFILPSKIEIDFNDNDFSSIVKGAIASEDKRCSIKEALCKGKLIISEKSPMDVKIVTIMHAVRTRGISRVPQPEPTYYNFKNKSLKIELIYNNITLLQSFYLK